MGFLQRLVNFLQFFEKIKQIFFEKNCQTFFELPRFSMLLSGHEHYFKAKLFMEKLIDIHISKNFTQHTFLSKVVIANIPKSNTFTSMETFGEPTLVSWCLMKGPNFSKKLCILLAKIIHRKTHALNLKKTCLVGWSGVCKYELFFVRKHSFLAFFLQDLLLITAINKYYLL